MKPRSAIKTDLFADEHHRKKIDSLGDPLADIELHIDFAELAATYAEGMEQATRGVVGPVPLVQAHPVLANVLRTSQPGELRPPVQIEPWWLVVRLESLQPASFDEAMQGKVFTLHRNQHTIHGCQRIHCNQAKTRCTIDNDIVE